MLSKKQKVASIQYEFSDKLSKEDRIKKAEKFIDSCADADLILLPELWNFGWHSLVDKDIASIDRLRTLSETLEGETISRMAEGARKVNSYIVAGSILERRNDSFYNTAVLLDPKGKIIATFSKMHLANYLGYQEAALLKPGRDITAVRTELGVLGFSICYDLRFPELYRKMAVNKGVEVFLLIAAFAMTRLENWLHLCHARAIENQCYLISCDAVGSDRGHQYLGYSAIIDPRGITIAGSGTSECIVKGEIDLEELYKFRKVMPNLQNRVLSV